MWYKDLFNELEKLYDENESISMSNYMQNKFKFLGIKKPKLLNFIKPYIKESKKNDLDWEFVNICWNKDYREAQYIALEYLSINSKKITVNDLDKLKYLIVNKSWWETVDTIDSFVGSLVLQDKSLESVMLEWSKDSNIWLKRVSIDYQQRFKENTNTKLLEQVIINNLGTDEFFINKAIGWSLREYSKTNPEWVKDFINKYNTKLNKLSIKEASKYI